MLSPVLFYNLCSLSMALTFHATSVEKWKKKKRKQTKKFAATVYGNELHRKHIRKNGRFNENEWSFEMRVTAHSIMIQLVVHLYACLIVPHLTQNHTFSNEQKNGRLRMESRKTSTGHQEILKIRCKIIDFLIGGQSFPKLWRLFGLELHPESTT